MLLIGFSSLVFISWAHVVYHPTLFVATTPVNRMLKLESVIQIKMCSFLSFVNATKCLDDYWRDYASFLQRRCADEFMDVRLVKRYDTVRAIAMGLVKVAGISTNIEVKVVNRKRTCKFYHDGSCAFNVLCFPENTWLASAP